MLTTTRGEAETIIKGEQRNNEPSPSLFSLQDFVILEILTGNPTEIQIIQAETPAAALRRIIWLY